MAQTYVDTDRPHSDFMLSLNDVLRLRGAEVLAAPADGAAVDGARFRATFELEDEDLGPSEEDDWIGRRLRIGDAEVRVRGLVPRCAVIDLDPATGVRDRRLLEALARGRRGGGPATFGVEADVTRPGRVRTGDPAGPAMAPCPA